PHCLRSTYALLFLSYLWGDCAHSVLLPFPTRRSSDLYGEAFKSYELPREQIQRVLDGEEYHGITNFPWSPFITGFFNNELRNTIGVPVHMDGETKALFVRPNAN